MIILENILMMQHIINEDKNYILILNLELIVLKADDKQSWLQILTKIISA